MTKDKTVTMSRELAEKCLDGAASMGWSIAEELRAMLAKSELADHCKQCADTVQTWPESKRDCLGKFAAPVVERQELVAELPERSFVGDTRNPYRQIAAHEAYIAGWNAYQDATVRLGPLYASPPPAPVSATHYEQMVSDLVEAIGNAHEECRSINHTKLWKWLDEQPGVSLTDCFGEPDSFGVEASSSVAVVLPERLTAAELEELEVIEVLLHGQGLSNLAGTVAAARQFIDEIVCLDAPAQTLRIPERKPIEALAFNWATADVENTGWNACLDKVKELNQPQCKMCNCNQGRLPCTCKELNQ